MRATLATCASCTTSPRRRASATRNTTGKWPAASIHGPLTARSPPWATPPPSVPACLAWPWPAAALFILRIAFSTGCARFLWPGGRHTTRPMPTCRRLRGDGAQSLAGNGGPASAAALLLAPTFLALDEIAGVLCKSAALLSHVQRFPRASAAQARGDTVRSQKYARKGQQITVSPCTENA